MDDTIQDCINAWNDFAEKWNREFGKTLISKVGKITQTRKSKLKNRLKDVMAFKHLGFHTPYDGWCLALDKIEEAGWMFGDSQRGWVVGFDNLIGEKFFIKLMEGGHNRATGAKQKTVGTYASGHTTSFGAMREIRAEYGARVGSDAGGERMRDQRPSDNRLQIEGQVERLDGKQGRLFG